MNLNKLSRSTHPPVINSDFIHKKRIGQFLSTSKYVADSMKLAQFLVD